MTLLAGDRYTITAHDPWDDSDDDIAERVAFANILEREGYPEDPVTTVEDAIKFERSLPRRVRWWSFRARDSDGTLVGGASFRLDPDHDENPDVLSGQVYVHPDHRRRGLGCLLLAELVGLSRELERTRLMAWTSDRWPAGASFLEALGAERKLEMHQNHLVLAEVDRPMLESWVSDGPRRAPDYEVVWWDERVPDEEVDAYAALVMVMNTAPMDDFDLNDFTMTPEQIREGEEQLRATGMQRWLAVARRVSDGALAGFHDVYWQASSPETAWVGATAVEPEHRGHALGKWLKAAVTIRMLDERPQVTEIRTGNADSNDAMLGINRAMGYKPMAATAGWELSVDQAEAYLRSRGLLAAE
jgi:mycothiol synthase